VFEICTDQLSDQISRGVLEVRTLVRAIVDVSMINNNNKRWSQNLESKRDI
jgi:hypothetical protein